MSHLHHLLIKYPFSCLMIVVIWILCLIPMPENPLSHVRLVDKWTHLIMYGGLCVVIWAEHLKTHHHVDRKKIWLPALLAPILMGGLVEIVQATCTNGARSGEWIDFLADVIGVALGQAIGILLARCFSKG
ncbi:VanZ-like protein [Prevotella sp. oral taxon 376]|uniref:VanZ family protein n=1 Tax=Prevotella sp. oral taxon 376 TaxID=712466 RepID=UPI000D1E4A7C|nr:VanZ family protein [Prevotella sp. oral taxon 376]PTL32377.1 VanZ-like protein [Prevotella sp. oral taxon 376]